MCKRELAGKILQQISDSISTVQYRMKSVKSFEDLVSTPEGMEKLDAVCMQLIAIGESLKNLDKVTGGLLLSKHPEIDWRGAMSMRDIICHQYFRLHREVVFSVCQEKLAPLADAIEKMKTEI
jgi:uncharacterized protein with HEPN domain